MPHYIVDATHKLSGEPGVLIVYAPDLEKAKELLHEKARFVYDVEGELIQRRPTPEEFRKAFVAADRIWFSSFAGEEIEGPFKVED